MNNHSFEYIVYGKAWRNVSAESMQVPSRSRTRAWSMSLSQGNDVTKFQIESSSYVDDAAFTRVLSVRNYFLSYNTLRARAVSLTSTLVVSLTHLLSSHLSSSPLTLSPNSCPLLWLLSHLLSSHTSSPPTPLLLQHIFYSHSSSPPRPLTFTPLHSPTHQLSLSHSVSSLSHNHQLYWASQIPFRRANVCIQQLRLVF